jgi:hypothetical protein
LGFVTIAAWTLFWTIILFGSLWKLNLLRVEISEEIEGLDTGHHGGAAYQWGSKFFPRESLPGPEEAKKAREEARKKKKAQSKIQKTSSRESVGKKSRDENSSQIEDEESVAPSESEFSEEEDNIRLKDIMHTRSQLEVNNRRKVLNRGTSILARGEF